MIWPHLPGNRNHHRQTDKGWGRELASLYVLSLLPPLEKKVKHWLHSIPAPTPPIAAFVGLPSARGGPRQLPIALPSLWFAPGNSVPSSFLQPPAPHSPITPKSSSTYSNLLSHL